MQKQENRADTFISQERLKSSSIHEALHFAGQMASLVSGTYRKLLRFPNITCYHSLTFIIKKYINFVCIHEFCVCVRVCVFAAHTCQRKTGRRKLVLSLSPYGLWVLNSRHQAW